MKTSKILILLLAILAVLLWVAEGILLLFFFFAWLLVFVVWAIVRTMEQKQSKEKGETTKT